MSSTGRPYPRLIDALPVFVEELESLLTEANESVIATQVKTLSIVSRCRCGDDFCATFYTYPKPQRDHGRNRRCICLEPKDGMIVLDVLDEQVVTVEVLFRDNIRQMLQAILP